MFGFIAGIIALIRPIHRIGLGTRKRAGLALLASFGAFVVGGLTMPPPTPEELAPRQAEETAAAETREAEEEKVAAGAPTAAEEAPQAIRLTGPQRNAVRSAEQYLRMTGFSRRGLIEQLSSSYGDGYDEADATVAVDSLDVNWDENAARSAKQYLSMTGFSCNGLIQQLSSDAGDKYTVSQATYGAQQAGAC